MQRTLILLAASASAAALGCANRGALSYQVAARPGPAGAAAAGAERAAAPTSDKPARAEPAAASSPETQRRAAVDPRKVIYTGVFDIVAADSSYASTSARALAEQLGGYVQRMTVGGIVLRVPAGRFYEAVAALKKIGPLLTREIAALDVTEEYADLEVRVKNSRAMLERLRALLEKANTVKAALEVEREMLRVRTEIERLQGKLNRMANRVAYATLTITFRPPAQVPPELKVSLPFGWLQELGLQRLTHFSGRRLF